MFPLALCHYLCHFKGMKALERPSTQSTVVSHSRHRVAAYQKVLNGRKQPVRGLWQRNGRFYARLAVEDPNTGEKRVRRVPLDPETVTTIPQAQAELRRLQTHRESNSLPSLKRTPKFRDYAQTYLKYLREAKDTKRASTIGKEKGSLDLWSAHLGGSRLDKINRAMINAFIAKRQGQGKSGRTVNLDVIAFRNVFKRAVDDEWVQRLPTENLRPLKWSSPKRELVRFQELEALCEAAVKATKNAVQFIDYVKLMAFAGTRRDETLRLRWADVDWDNQQLTVGADGLAKNYKSRVVDFNAKLEAHLKQMKERRAPDSQFLFPSPQRGEKDSRAKSFNESMKLARAALSKDCPGAKKICFHDCRHFFISMCVMSGIDYLTIAKWVGHQDGGVLIGKVYGHLTNEHARKQAEKIQFI
jgi:integrase